MAKTRPKLTPREKSFIMHYLSTLNGAASARKAGYSAKNARQHAHDLLTKPYIVAEINQEMEKKVQKLEINADFTLGKIAALAKGNIKNVAQWAEDVLVIKDSAAMTMEEAYAIESLQLKQTLRGPEVKIKMRSPESALELLARHQGLLESGGDKDASDEMAAALAELNREEAAASTPVASGPDAEPTEEEEGEA